MKHLLPVLALLLTLNCGGQSVSRAPENNPRVTSLVAKGNLQSLRPLDCIELSAVKRTNTPADIFIGVRKCIEQKNLDGAVDLFAAAGVFGYFDTQRVSDASAHQAMAVLPMQAFADQDDPTRVALQQKMEDRLGDAESLRRVCDQLHEIGYPTYHPAYMIQHGMGAFLGGSGNGLKQDFNAKRSWDLSLKTYLHCE